MVETVVTVERTTTTTTGAPGTGGRSSGFSGLQLNVGYFKMLPGILKLIQFVLGILCMALASPAFFVGTSFFLFVVVTSFIATLLWIFAYLLGIREALNLAVNWIYTELLNTGLISILYFIAFVIQFATWSGLQSSFRVNSNIAAGVFGLFNFLAYAVGTYFLYLEHKSGSTI